MLLKSNYCMLFLVLDMYLIRLEYDQFLYTGILTGVQERNIEFLLYKNILVLIYNFL